MGVVFRLQKMKDFTLILLLCSLYQQNTVNCKVLLVETGEPEQSGEAAPPKKDEIKECTGSNATKTIHGDDCVFPFRYGGKKYCACTKEGSETNEKWCATEVNDQGGLAHELAFENCKLGGDQDDYGMQQQQQQHGGWGYPWGYGYGGSQQQQQ